MLKTLTFLSTTLLFSGLCAAQVVTQWYSEKGLAGSSELHQTSDTQLTAKFKLAWNNRRYIVNETYLLDGRGYPTSIDIEGLAPFGDKIVETFSYSDGYAQWQSRPQSTRIRLEKNSFYLPADGVETSILIKALLKDPDQRIETLPSGTVSLQTLKDITVSEQDKQLKVKLYALSGLSLSPIFLWGDEQGQLFAQNLSGRFKGIRQGWSMDTFEQLDAITLQAEEEYYADLNDKLTQPLTTPLLIENVNLVDVSGLRTVANQSVLVEQGKISQIGQDLSVPANTRKIDGSGKTLIPGLWDMHGHLSKEDGLNYLASGVTSVRDVGSPADAMKRIESLFAERMIGPRIYKAGFMDRKSEYSSSTGKTITSLQEAKDAVDWYADNGYIQIKTYSSMEPEWMAPLAKHIHARGMRLSGHIPAYMSADQAIDAGFDEIQHINMLFLNFFNAEALDTRKQLRFTVMGNQAHTLDLNSPEVLKFVDKLADKGIEVDLTLSTFNSLLLTRNQQVDGEYADIADHFPANFVRSLMTATMDVSDKQTDHNYQKSAQAMLAMTKLLHDRGVPIIAGTDYYSGFTLHRELVLYAKAGIPPLEVLRIATLGAAEVSGAAPHSGSITVGKDADLVLIDGNPVEDMTHLRRAILVVQGDKLYRPDGLHRAMGVKPFVETTAP